MRKIIRYCLLTVLICLNAALVALALKANIGIDAWAACSQSLAQLFHIQVGTMEMIFNCMCVFLQMMILKKDIRFAHFLQIPLSIIIGHVINFVYYDILVFDLSNYYMRLVIIIGFYILSAFIVAGILIINEITYPLEGLCSTIASKTGLTFARLRQSVDIICVIMSVCISLFYHLPFSIREGTIIGVLIFGPLIDIAIKKEKKWFSWCNQNIENKFS